MRISVLGQFAVRGRWKRIMSGTGRTAVLGSNLETIPPPPCALGITDNITTRATTHSRRCTRSTSPTLQGNTGRHHRIGGSGSRRMGANDVTDYLFSDDHDPLARAKAALAYFETHVGPDDVARDPLLLNMHRYL